MQKYYLFNFNGYTVSVSANGSKKDNLKEKAQILAQAEAIKQSLDYKTFSVKEINNIEFMCLTTHLKVTDN